MKKAKLIRIIITGLIIIAAILFFMFSEEKHSDAPLYIILLISIMWGIFKAIKVRIKIKFNKNTMISFAKNNNFKFLSNLKIPKEKYRYKLFKNANNRKMFNRLSGIYKGHQVEIYNYQCYLEIHPPSENESSPASTGYTVFEIKNLKVLPNVVPSAIITQNDSYLSDVSKIYPQFGCISKLQTESNEFNKGFEIILDSNQNNKDELGILKMLSPDMMAFFIDKKKNGTSINFELNKNAIILYIDGIIKKEKDLKEALNFAIYLAKETEKIFPEHNSPLSATKTRL